MNPLLEGMKERLEIARTRLQKAQQTFQAAQAELQAATGEYTTWNSAISLLMREEEKRAAEANEKQIPMDLPDLKPTSNDAPTAKPSDADDALLQRAQESTLVNQTEKVREILRAHNSGLTPAGIWEEGRHDISSRAYLYAILKRLRDSDEVVFRRGKYQFKSKPIAINGAEQGVTL